MITVLNEFVIGSIKAELAWQGMTQLDLALRVGKPPAYIQRRLSGNVPLSLTDTEYISSALGVTLVQPVRRSARRAS